MQPRKLDLPLTLMGAASLAGYVYAAFGLRGTGQTADILAFLGLFSGLFVLYFLAVFRSRRHSLAAVPQILLWAFLFRLALLPAGLKPESWTADLAADVRSEEVTYRTFLLYDNDVWRYLWDGHVGAAGIDPYAYTPAEIEELAIEGEPELEALFEDEPWQDVFDQVTYQDYRTVYPPLAQLFFRTVHGIAPGSVFVYKAALALVDFATCCLLVLLLRRWGRPESALFYAWNPLVLEEIAGSGHVDGLMIFFLVAAVWATVEGFRRLGLVAFALAVLVKLTPILLAGLFLRRNRPRDWVLLPLVGGLAYLPFLDSLPLIASGLKAFADEWVFNPGPWAFVHWIATEGLGFSGRGVADAFAAGTTLAIVGWVLWRDDGRRDRLVTGALWILGSYVVLSATVMPWYLLWALPFAAVRRCWSWLALTWLSLLSYLIYIDQVSHAWWRWAQFAPFLLLLGFELWRRGKEPGPRPSPA